MRGEADGMDIVALVSVALAACTFLVTPSVPGCAGQALPPPGSPLSSRPVQPGAPRSPLPDANGWHWPLALPITVLRGFQPPALPWNSGHRGVDLAAKPEQPVFAAGSGEVTYAGALAGRGVVAVTHDLAAAMRTTYVPVRASVMPGSRVSAGSKIGTVEGVTGHCGPRTCLHWGLLQGRTYRNPLDLLCRPTMRLFPVWRPRETPAHDHPLPTTPTRRPGSPAKVRPAPAVALSGASEAGGGAVIGMLVTLTLAFLWGQFRQRRPARPLPPEVIDLGQERKRRRISRSPTKGDSSA